MNGEEFAFFRWVGHACPLMRNPEWVLDRWVQNKRAMRRAHWLWITEQRTLVVQHG